MDVTEALTWVQNWNGTRNGSSYEGEVYRVLAAEVVWLAELEKRAWLVFGSPFWTEEATQGARFILDGTVGEA
jgi:hypothetical protein